MKSEKEQEFNDYIYNAICNILTHKLPTQEESDANFKIQAEWLCNKAFLQRLHLLRQKILRRKNKNYVDITQNY